MARSTGTVPYAQFSLMGAQFAVTDCARDHRFALNEAVSFVVPCDTREELDYFWESCRPVQKLSSVAG